MLEIIHQKSVQFEELSAMQFGWRAEFTQLGPARQASMIDLVHSGNVGTCRFQYHSDFDQRAHAQPGYYSFGLLESDTSRTLVEGRTVPSGTLIAFPRENEAHAVSRVGSLGLQPQSLCDLLDLFFGGAIHAGNSSPFPIGF